MTAKKLFFAYVRSVTGLVLGGVFWFCVGWALSSTALGLVLAVWAVVIGPVLLPWLTWHPLRWRGQLEPLDLTKDPVLAREYFAGVLAKPGPNPRVWVRPSTDLSCLWFERLIPGVKRQEIVVTRAWMRQDASLRARDWRALWSTIARMSPAERNLRSLQIAAWCGVFSFLDPLLIGLQFLFDWFGLSDLPSPAFWFQRVCWAIRGTWFGLPYDSGLIPNDDFNARPREPGVWNSATWGVWFQIPARIAHPLWRLFMHRSAFLEEKAV